MYICECLPPDLSIHHLSSALPCYGGHSFPSSRRFCLHALCFTFSYPWKMFQSEISHSECFSLASLTKKLYLEPWPFQKILVLAPWQRLLLHPRSLQALHSPNRRSSVQWPGQQCLLSTTNTEIHQATGEEVAHFGCWYAPNQWTRRPLKWYPAKRNWGAP